MPNAIRSRDTQRKRLKLPIFVYSEAYSRRSLFGSNVTVIHDISGLITKYRE
jgi:hypothetical protein